MWWDVWANLPYVLQKQEEAAKASLSYLLEWISSHPDLVEAGWAAMKQALATGHRLCIEGALRGLRHWQFEESGTATVIIDEFLASHLELPPALREYAMRAREGDVQ